MERPTMTAALRFSLCMSAWDYLFSCTNSLGLVSPVPHGIYLAESPQGLLPFNCTTLDCTPVFYYHFVSFPHPADGLLHLFAVAGCVGTRTYAVLHLFVFAGTFSAPVTTD
jgi:hypothetical protein